MTGNRHTPAAKGIGRTLRRERERLGMSRPELARRCGLTTAEVTRIEAGHGDPTITGLINLADGVGMNLPQLLVPIDSDHEPSA